MGLVKLMKRCSHRIFKDEEKAESGAALVFVAISMTVLVAFAAFSVDFGWLYLNGLRIQHGADAAALAGVIYEPGDQATAYIEAHAAANVNGYDTTATGTTVTPVDYTDDASAVDNQFQLAVTIEHTVPTFFMKIFGVDQISMSKRAVAEYVLPLPMGSNLPYFGTDPDDSSRQPNLWANIHGYYTGQAYGDRYSSQCKTREAGSSCTPTGDQRPTVVGTATDADGHLIPTSGGYLYGVEVAGNGLTVEVFDGTFYRGGGDHFLVGDNERGGSVGPTTWFILYKPDPTPLNTSDNTIACTVRYEPQFTFADIDGNGTLESSEPDTWAEVEAALPGGIGSLWDPMCTSNAGAGVYPLRVVIEANDEQGLNRYSMRASTSTGPQPRLYGLGDMSIYANFPGGNATFDLAEVYPVHAGKELVIELWDPDSGNESVSILKPDGNGPSCTWTSTDGHSGSSPTCDIDISSYNFDDDHMQIRIDIDGAYTCTTDCWWEINVGYSSSSAQDTTTWSAHIEGNPVKLVE